MFGIGFSSAAFAATIVSTFDFNSEEWTTDAGGDITHNPYGGNTGGFLSIEDIAGDTYVAFPPSKFKGDLLEFNGGLLSYDVLVIDPVATLSSIGSGFGRIQMHGGGLNATFDYAPNPSIPSSQEWMKYYVPMTAEAWNTTQENWEKLLSDVTYMDIILEPKNWSTVGLDNFKIKSASNPVPEPATMLLFGPALLGLSGIKRKRKRRK